jgi:hypothetical protein
MVSSTKSRPALCPRVRRLPRKDKKSFLKTFSKSDYHYFLTTQRIKNFIVECKRYDYDTAKKVLMHLCFKLTRNMPSWDVSAGPGRDDREISITFKAPDIWMQLMNR